MSEDQKYPESAFVKIDIPKKADIFLSMAIDISRLSKDAQTQCGCIVTDHEHHIIGGGYNSFPRNFPDDEIPNVRPWKYPYVLHAEANALAFCYTRPVGGTVYVTGIPCVECIKRMHQEGIVKCVYIKDGLYNKPTMMNDEDSVVRDNIVKWSRIEFVEVEPDFNFLVDKVDHLKATGLISK